MVQVVEMTDEEKFEMYMKVPHEDLVRMKIEEERVLNQLEKELEKYRNNNYTTTPELPGMKVQIVTVD